MRLDRLVVGGLGEPLGRRCCRWRGKSVGCGEGKVCVREIDTDSGDTDQAAKAVSRMRNTEEGVWRQQ